MFVPITSINRADAYLTEVEANMAALVKSPLEEQSRIEAINNVKASGDEIITSYETEWLTTLSPELQPRFVTSGAWIYKDRGNYLYRTYGCVQKIQFITRHLLYLCS